MTLATVAVYTTQNSCFPDIILGNISFHVCNTDWKVDMYYKISVEPLRAFVRLWSRWRHRISNPRLSLWNSGITIVIIPFGTQGLRPESSEQLHKGCHHHAATLRTMPTSG